MALISYPLAPMPAPRHRTYRDKRTGKVRTYNNPGYKKWKRQAQMMHIQVSDDAVIIFRMPMPKSWTKKEKDAARHTPHQVKPDLDNLVKALLDAVHPKDQRVWCCAAMKIWADEGRIDIGTGAFNKMVPEDPQPFVTEVHGDV